METIPDRPFRGQRFRLLIAIPALVYAVASAAFVQDSHSLFSFPLDDAWIHRVYSSSLWHGQGFAYNTGVQEAGSSSPLWSILSAPAHALEPLGTKWVVLAVKVLCLLCGLAAVLLVGSLAAAGSGSLLTGSMAGTIFALDSRLLFSAFSGMENNLLVALWLGTAAALCSGRNLSALVLVGLIPVTRPEGVLLLPLALWPWLALLRRHRIWLSVLAAPLLAVAPLGAWSVFCHATTGHWLPNTYYMKATPIGFCWPEVPYAWSLLRQYGHPSLWHFPIGLVAFAVALSAQRWPGRLRMAVILLLLPALYFAGVLATRWVNPAGYYWTRWIDSAALVLTVPFCSGMACLLSWAVQSKTLTARLIPDGSFLKPRAIGFAAALLIVSSVHDSARAFMERRNRLAGDSRAIAVMNVGLGKWLVTNTDKSAVIAVNDAGATRYFSRRLTIDILGLNNADIAFGRISRTNALLRADWVAVFPAWFEGTEIEATLKSAFTPCHEILMPIEEYTVAPNSGQSYVVVYRHR